MNANANHVIKTVSWGVLWRTLRYPFLLLSLFVIPKIMGSETYGKFALFLSVYMMSESFMGLGNIQIFGRFLPEHGPDEHERTSGFLHGMLWYGVLAALAISGVAVLLILTLRGDDFPTDWILMLVLILLLGKIQGTLFSFIYGRNQIGRFSVRALIRSMSRFVFVALFYIWFGLDGALWAFVVNEFILVCLSAFWSRDYLFASWQHPRFSEFFPLLKFGLAFYVPICLLGILQRSGNVVIKALARGDESEVYSQVAHFDLANQFLLVTVSFFAIFLITLVPSLTHLHINEQHERIRSWLSLVLTYCGLLGVFAVNALTCFGRDVIMLIGEGFEGTYGTALIMSIAIFPLIIGHVGNNIAVVEKEPRINILATLSGLLCMFVFFVFLIPVMGAGGAAWSSVAGYFVYALVFIAHYRTMFRNILKKFMVVFGVGILTIPAYLNTPGLPSSVIWFLAITAGQLALLWLLGIVNPRHLTQIKSALT